MTPAISVLIRTFNSAATLPEVLTRLDLQPEDEIIVVDSGSSDATLAIAEQYHARIVIAGQPFNYSKSLNLGFATAKNPWVLVLSSHCIPIAPQYLSRWRVAIEKFPANVVVAFGTRLLSAKENPPGNSETPSYLNRTEWERHKQTFAGNSNALYRKEGWRCRAFNEQLPTAEDLEWLGWALQSGYDIAHLPGMTVLYRNRGSLRYMYAKGFIEAKIGRTILGTGKISLMALGVAMGFLVKKLFLGRIPPDVFMKQCAHQYGAFWGSRRLPSEEKK
jgi:glycosyltransferase involved in cell wall biosynthesis